MPVQFKAPCKPYSGLKIHFKVCIFEVCVYEANISVIPCMCILNLTNYLFFSGLS